MFWPKMSIVRALGACKIYGLITSIMVDFVVIIIFYVAYV